GNPFVADESKFFRMEALLSVANAPPPSQSASVMFDRWVEIIQQSVQSELKVGILYCNNEQRERIENLLTHRNIPFAQKNELLNAVFSSSTDRPGVYLSSGDLASHLQILDAGWILIPDHILF